MNSSTENSESNKKLNKEMDGEATERKTYAFLTMKNLFQESLRSKKFFKKTYLTSQKHVLLGNRYNKLEESKRLNPTLEKENETEPNILYEKFLEKEEVKNLDYKQHNYLEIWNKFLLSVNKIECKNKNSDKFFPSEDDRKVHILSEIMKHMEYLLEEQDNKIEEITEKIYLTQEDIKRLYFQSHQTREKELQTKKKLQYNQEEYDKFLYQLNEEKKEREKSRQISQQIHHMHALKTENEQRSRETSPIKYMTDLNLSEKEIQKIIEKRNKLNLELDLKFELQLRKKNQQQKASFEDNKKKLEQEKNFIINRIKEISQKIQFKEKEIERNEKQKEKLKEEVKVFLKMLLKNPDYRSDGALWIFRKMIEYGFKPEVFDFSEKLDLNARLFLINEFNLMKGENTFQLKPEKKKKHLKKQENKVQNRTRVKSLAFFKNDEDEIRNSNLNLNSPPKETKNLFNFGSRNLNIHETNLGMRKKSGSLTLIKNCESFLDSENELAAVNREKIEKSLTKTLINVTNSKKVYDSTKKYLKTWVSNQGWNSITPRGFIKAEEPKIPEKFITEEKERAKSTYFKVGRSNKKYKEVVKTLFGEEDMKNLTARRIKTSRE